MRVLMLFIFFFDEYRTFEGWAPWRIVLWRLGYVASTVVWFSLFIFVGVYWMIAKPLYHGTGVEFFWNDFFDDKGTSLRELREKVAEIDRDSGVGA